MSEARAVGDELPPGFVLQPRAEKQEESSGGLAGIWDGLVSGIKRMGAGMAGEDVSRAGRFGMGLADPVYGGAQIGARMMAQPGGGIPEQAVAPDMTFVSPSAPSERPAAGLQQSGNIDLKARPIVRNRDGSISTVRSMSFNEDGREVLIPTVAADGSRILSDQDATDQYRKTGQFLGKFDTPDNATTYAKQLHQDQEKEYSPRDYTATVDKIVQQRETGYQQREKAAGLDGGLGTEWARILGNVAGTAPLAAIPGGAATMPGRISSAAAGGALGATTMPVAGGNFGVEKAKQAGLGAAGGAVLGAAGEGVSSALSRAIAIDDPNAVLGAFRRVVKPGTGVARNEQQLTTQDSRILTAVDQIIARNPREADPKSLREFAASIDKTKRGLFEEYDTHARAAGDLGVQVDLKPAIDRLREIAKKPEVVDLHPRLPAEAELLAQNLEKRGFYTPSAAQDFIENVNQTLHAFYKNPTEQSVSRATLLAPVVSTMREELDKAITGATGPGYQILRDRYGALKSIEESVSKAVQREAQKMPGGLAGQFADLASTEQFIHGIFRLDPSAIANAATIRAARAAVKKLNDPNRAIQQIFRQRRAGLEIPGGRFQQGVAQGISAARPYATGASGLIGGEGLANRLSGGPTSTYRYRGGLGRDQNPELIGTPVGR